MPEQPRLDPFAIESTAKKLYNQYGKGNWDADWEHLHPRIRAEYIDKVAELVGGYFAAALPGSPSGRWTVSTLRTHFEWGGQVRLDPAKFDRVLANVRAEALEEMAHVLEADMPGSDRGNGQMTAGRHIMRIIRTRAAQIRKETKTE
ncbi:hypothetical protein [Glutamicibacter soli]|uniref:hypothetical protein n=1 Tax=Glutamicibacter soli TaxID=453836 RepID=UPI003FD5922F